MKKTFPVAIVGFLLLAAIGAYFLAKMSAKLPITKAPPTEWPIIDSTKSAPTMPGGGGSVPSEAGGTPSVNAPENQLQAQEQTEETHVVSPVIEQYWPEASVNLTGGTLGNQRVPFTDGIGDIHQVLFHLPSYTLFMAVTEPNGMRSVWQMHENRKPERVFAGTDAKGDLVLFQTSDGTVYVQMDNPCSLYRSGDGLKSWHLVSRDACMFWSMADDGKGNVYATIHNWNEATLWRSPDDGFSWERWKDFQQLFPEYAVTYAENDDRMKLRHLHDVLYDQQSGTLVVGTGDVARYAFASQDDGQTWMRIWDEGFTSHVAMSGGDRFLLGPDQLHNHGIGLYDVKKGTTKEVWNPRPYGYAGYVYSMANVDGIYYAAVHTEANEVDSIVPKFGIITSPDGLRWYRFLEWGPLGNHARTDIWITPAPGIIYASINGSLYAFRPLDKAWFSDKEPFDDTHPTQGH